MPTRTLIRPDGSKLVVHEQDAQRLLTLGYREQSETEEREEAIGRGQEKYYTSPGQKVITGAEGLASGLSVGLTDLALSEDGKERARYNPGVRIGTELIGGLLPLAPGGIGKIASLTPAGALTRGAAKAGEALGGGSKVVNAMVRGTVEGAGLGAGAAITTAQVTGDPLTAEAVIAGMGWGSLFGGGLSALGSGVASKMESRAEQKLLKEEAKFSRVGVEEAHAAERAQGRVKVHSVLTEGMKEEHASVKYMEDNIYGRIRHTVKDAAEQMNLAKVQAEDVAKELNFGGIKSSQMAIKAQLTENYLIKDVKKAFTRGQVELAKAQAFAREGKYDRMVTSLDKYKEYMVEMEGALGGPKFFNSEKIVGQANDLIGLAKYRLDGATRAAEDLVQMEAVRSELNTFPKTAEEFTAMTPGRVEKLGAAIDHLGKLRSAEMAGVQEAVKDAITHMSEGLGVKLEGTPGGQLQGMWKLLKGARSKRAGDELRMAQEGNLLWRKADQKAENAEMARARGDRLKAESRGKGAFERSMESMARYGAGSWAANKLGPGGYVLGASLVTGLVGLKGAILSTIADKANKWVPRAATGLARYGSRIEPLAVRIDGSMDEAKNRKDLIKLRAKEINEAAPSVRDTLYRSVQPLAIEHPELALQSFKHGVERFRFIMSKLPKDPGYAYSNLKSLWKPDAVAIEKFARYYEVFHNPVGVMSRALDTGKVTMEAAEGLQEMNPELWQVLRVHLLERISDPKVASKMKYHDQVHMGLLLGIDLHSTMTPYFIAAQQQMYVERNQPLEMSPRIQPGGGAGRPSGPGPSATSGQRITEH